MSLFVGRLVRLATSRSPRKQTTLLDPEIVYSEQVLDGLSVHRAMVPVIWVYELSNVLTRSAKQGRLNMPMTDAWACLDQLSIQVEPTRPRPRILAALAEHTGLSAYDAGYLHLALEKSLPLASRDKELIHAAQPLQVRMFAP